VYCTAQTEYPSSGGQENSKKQERSWGNSELTWCFDREWQLTAIVLTTTPVREATDEQLVRLPTGDGMALVFRFSCANKLDFRNRATFYHPSRNPFLIDRNAAS
jgi:hypothetical protein